MTEKSTKPDALAADDNPIILLAVTDISRDAAFRTTLPDHQKPEQLRHAV